MLFLFVNVSSRDSKATSIALLSVVREMPQALLPILDL